MIDYKHPFAYYNHIYVILQVAKLYCGGKAGTNMKLMAEALERETGGIVIHRSGGSVYLYKGDWS